MERLADLERLTRHILLMSACADSVRGGLEFRAELRQMQLTIKDILKDGRSK